MSESSFQTEAMEVARKIARFKFRKDPDSAAKVEDAVSVAWETSQTPPPNSTPGTVARYAVQRVACGRQFDRTVKSIDGPPSEYLDKPERTGFQPDEISRDGDDPAEIAAFQIDFDAFLKTLTRQQKKILMALAMGDRTGEAARRFRVTDVRISRYRTLFRDRWEEFIS